MNADDQLQDLLLQWEDLREQGQTPSPEEVCRDCPELIERFRSLAGALAGLGALMGEPSTLASDTVSAPHSPAAPGGARYRPTALHARGGLGEVFLAEDAELHRPVALKQMQAHLADDAGLRRRFLLEAEVTGRLEHPGIVPVYGLGHDDQGRPYYAMRFIKGETLQEAIARYHQAPTDLALRSLLTRFVAVCNAVAYAHSRGILHRDLKPANVMLGPYGETLVVDWGLARPIERGEAARQGGEETLTPTPDLRTDETRGVVGTPAYMSPEQAAGLHTLVGPASDVYSLGATLYHLLTGQAPFGRGAIEEVLIAVQHGAFPPPRARKPDVPRALEAVCLKAMALERYARYATATELAADLEAYLADEPVTARREPWAERARRWVKRRRTAVLATAAAGVVALVTLGIATLLLESANRRERLARQRAENMFTHAGATNATLLALVEDFKPAPGASAEATLRALREVNNRYDELLREGGDRADLLAGKAQVLTSLAEAHILVGDTQSARQCGDEAIALYEQLRAAGDAVPHRAGEAAAREQLAQALLFQGDLENGTRQHAAALALREGLARDEPRQPTWLALQARSHNFLGNVLRVRGHDRAAAAHVRQSIALSRAALALDPQLALARGRLAHALEREADRLYYREDYVGAVKLYEEALREVGAAMRGSGGTTGLLQQQAGARLSLGWTYRTLGDLPRAGALIEQAHRECQRFYDLAPSNNEWERLRWQAHAYAGYARPNTGSLAEDRQAAARLRDSLQRAKDRATRDPHNVEWAMQYASVRGTLATVLLGLANQGDQREANLAEADRLLGEAVALLEQLHRAVPDHLPIADSLGRAYHQRHLLARVRGQADLAAAMAARQRRYLEDYYQKRIAGDDRLTWMARLALVKRQASDELGRQGTDYAAAVRVAKEAARLYEALHEAEPTHVPWLRELAMAYDAARRSLVLQANRSTPSNAKLKAEAIHHLEWARAAREQLARLQPDEPRWPMDLAACYHELADQRRLAGDPAGEDRYYQKYLDTLQAAYAKFPAEAARDPFAPENSGSMVERIGGLAVPNEPQHRRNRLRLSERLYALNRRPRLGVDLAEMYIDPVRRLDLSIPAEARQARLYVQRGLGLLRELQRGRALHPVHARLIPFFEAKLRSLTDARQREQVPPDWREAWEELNFHEWFRRAADGKRVAELVPLLDRLIDASESPTSLQIAVRYRLVEALSLRPALADAVLREARRQVARLSGAGRVQFAWLARVRGDGASVQALAATVATAPHDTFLATVWSIRLGVAGQLLAGARVYDIAIRSKKRATADDFVGLAQVWLRVGRSAEALAALADARKRGARDEMTRGLGLEALMTGRQFAAARQVIDGWLGEKGVSAATAVWLRAVRGWALAEMGDRAAGEKELRAVLKQAPGQAYARVTLIWVLAGTEGGLAEATKLAEALHKQYPDGPAAWMALARVRIAGKKAGEVVAELRKLGQVEPTCFDPYLFELLGDAGAQVGQRDEAVAAWKRALELWPKAAAKEDPRRKAIETKATTNATKEHE